ncbi:13746_t:CDS:2, partial [Funneliformis geosporum]
ITFIENMDSLTHVLINKELINQLYQAYIIKAKLIEHEFKVSLIKLTLKRHYYNYKNNQRNMINSLINWDGSNKNKGFLTNLLDPIAHIDPSIYNNLMILPTEEEWYNMINELHNNKALKPF